MNLMNKDSFTSLELVELINQYRNEEGNKSPLRHDNLLQIIKDEFEEEIGLLKIQETPYIHPQNKQKYPMYVLDHSQSRQVLVRESKFVRKAVISYIDKLENKLLENKIVYILPQDFPSALRALAISTEEKQRLELENKVKDQQIAELQPKATYYDLVLQCKDLLSTTMIAKDYGMSATALNKILAGLGVQFRQSDVWFMYAEYQDKGYTSTKTQTFAKSDGTLGSKPHMYWTQKGRLFLYALFKSQGIVPQIEGEDEEVILNEEMLTQPITDLN